MSHTVENDWITKSGLRAVVLFVHDSHRCGYVGVPKTHPLYEVEYSQRTQKLRRLSADTPIGYRGIIPLMCRPDDDIDAEAPYCYFDVHGGLTYSGGDENYPAKSDGLWWFGFDCGHAGDATKYWSAPGDVMRSQSYVEQHCESLAEQLQAVKESV